MLTPHSTLLSVREQIDALGGEKQIEMSATFKTDNDNAFDGDQFTFTTQEAIDGKFITDYVVIAVVFTTSDEDNEKANGAEKNVFPSIPDGLEDENTNSSDSSQSSSVTELNLEKKRQKAVIQYIEENHISNRATLVFFNNVGDAEQAAKVLNGKCINAATVTAATNASKRTEIRENLAKGYIEVVCLVGCWNEGISIDEVKTIIYADPRSSQTNIIQTFSRANRLHESKPYFKVVIPVCESDFDQDKFVKTVKSFVTNDERVRKAILNKNMKRFTVEVLAEGGVHKEDTDEEEIDAEADRQTEILFEKIFDRFGELVDSPGWISFKKFALIYKQKKETNDNPTTSGIPTHTWVNKNTNEITTGKKNKPPKEDRDQYYNLGRTFSDIKSNGTHITKNAEDTNNERKIWLRDNLSYEYVQPEGNKTTPWEDFMKYAVIWKERSDHPTTSGIPFDTWVNKNKNEIKKGRKNKPTKKDRDQYYNLGQIFSDIKNHGTHITKNAEDINNERKIWLRNNLSYEYDQHS